jgi:hypothetical protein
MHRSFKNRAKSAVLEVFLRNFWVFEVDFARFAKALKNNEDLALLSSQLA